ncbi:hypothetical protein ACFQT0_16060 [Hymenobacter humi]|uniref:Uncharacterized protein n=1 Tax=Hymenobacter humi TaxID=1411620 RepID=A0ABW2U5K2_9BACT
MPFCLFRPGSPARFAFLLLCCWLAMAGTARATHIVGGEMELVHTTGDAYTLQLNLYFDAVNGSATALDGQLTASIFEKATNKRMANVLLPWSATRLSTTPTRPAPSPR